MWRNKEIGNKYKLNHYYKNRDKYLKLRKKRYDEVKGFLRELKGLRGCTDCEVKDWRVLEFDHVRGEKKFGFDRAHDYHIDKVLEEIKKCEVVCANCHKIRTLNRMRNVKQIKV